jgi:signal peptidase I
MYPSLLPGQYVLLDKGYFKENPIRRGDIIAFRSKGIRKKLFVKRVIGLPGEKISVREQKIFINDNKLIDSYNKSKRFNSLPFTIDLKDDEYFVLGDNRKNSLDSRKLGPVWTSDIKGLIWVRLSPPSLL